MPLALSITSEDHLIHNINQWPPYNHLFLLIIVILLFLLGII